MIAHYGFISLFPLLLIFATVASVVLDLPIYDTQCGAKLFRVNDTLRAALAEPFPDRWSFDVELLARLLHPVGGVPPIDAEQIVEVPLTAWRDVGGSKLHTLPAARSLLALAGVRRRVVSRERLKRAASGDAAGAGR